MATIRQLESGGWQAVVRRKGAPAQYRSFEHRADAEAWAAEVEREIRLGIYGTHLAAERLTLKELIGAFEREYAPHHYRQREDKKEAWRFQLARLNEVLGQYSLANLDRSVVAKYRDERLKGNDERKPVGDTTVRKELYMLSKVLAFAQSEKGITLARGNPVEHVRKPKEGGGRDRRLTAEEWAVFEKECQASRNPWLWPAVQLAVETAMRQGELLNLRWQDIDKPRRIALLLDPKKIKTEEPRAVPLSSRALAVLDPLPKSVSGRVIPVNRMTLYSAFAAACDRAKVTDFTFHDLRHEALSRLAERGDLSVLELAAVSGHKTLQMLKRYTHLQAEKLAKKLG